jgi:Bacterial transcriptional activator domain
MLALYRSGRQGDALAAFRQARQVLVDELGAEPGTELRDLRQRMLAADPALALTGPGPGPASGAAVLVTPRELPGTAAHFTGRGAELAALTRQLGELAGRPSNGTLVISAIGGTAGVGKTALAVRWAHQVASRLPDGQLYADLHGYDPGEPVTAAAALAAFLRALGVPGQEIPAGEGERAARNSQGTNPSFPPERLCRANSSPSSTPSPRGIATAGLLPHHHARGICFAP